MRLLRKLIEPRREIRLGQAARELSVVSRRSSWRYDLIGSRPRRAFHLQRILQLWIALLKQEEYCIRSIRYSSVYREFSYTNRTVNCTIISKFNQLEREIERLRERRAFRFRDNGLRLECTRNHETVIIEAGNWNGMSPHDCGQRNSIKPRTSLERELDLRDLARSITRGKSVRTRCIISRCRGTMRGIKLEIGESSYRKSVNRLTAVRSEKAGAETVIPALELFRLFLLLRNRFCSCGCSCECV